MRKIRPGIGNYHGEAKEERGKIAEGNLNMSQVSSWENHRWGGVSGENRGEKKRSIIRDLGKG